MCEKNANTKTNAETIIRMYYAMAHFGALFYAFIYHANGIKCGNISNLDIYAQPVIIHIADSIHNRIALEEGKHIPMLYDTIGTARRAREHVNMIASIIKTNNGDIIMFGNDTLSIDIDNTINTTTNHDLWAYWRIVKTAGGYSLLCQGLCLTRCPTSDTRLCICACNNDSFYEQASQCFDFIRAVDDVENDSESSSREPKYWDFSNINFENKLAGSLLDKGIRDSIRLLYKTRHDLGLDAESLQSSTSYES